MTRDECVTGARRCGMVQPLRRMLRVCLQHGYRPNGSNGKMLLEGKPLWNLIRRKSLKGLPLAL